MTSDSSGRSHGPRDQLIPKLVVRDGIDPKTVVLHTASTRPPPFHDPAAVSVLRGAALDETEADHIVGEQVNSDDGSSVSDIDILDKATVRKSKLTNIFGRVIKPENNR
jgi:hypothetical protein